ncbi:MAG TPA: hypothetical protein VHC70_11145 [Phycisphaerales bacterium]|nr:hypothetical protein [Phycisphaerales bacterium]
MTSTTKPGRSPMPIGLVCALLGWHLVYVLAAAFPSDFTLGLVRLGLWALAAAAVVALPFIAWKRRSKPFVAVAVVLVLLMGAQWRWGIEVGLRARFAILHARLSADMLDVFKGFPATHWRGARGVQVEKQPDGQPRAVAFVDDGLIDNWSGFVYAPGGGAMSDGRVEPSLAQCTRMHPIPSPMRGWFGGDMTYAIPLGDGWYYCWFT